MFADATTYVDVDKYFKGCFVKFKEYGDIICQIEKTTPEGILAIDEYGNKVAIELDGALSKSVGYTFDYIMPKKAWFQWGNSASFLLRIPARMWKKGISKENTAINTLLSNGKFTSRTINFESICAYTNKKHYLSLKDLNGNESIALSPRFALCSNGKIFLDLNCIGNYDRKQDIIIIQRLFKEEIITLFPNSKVFLI